MTETQFCTYLEREPLFEWLPRPWTCEQSKLAHAEGTCSNPFKEMDIPCLLCYCFTCTTVALALMAERHKRGTVEGVKMNRRANSCCGACMKPAAGSLTITTLGSLCPSCMPGHRWCQPAVLLMSMCSIMPGNATCSGTQVVSVCISFQVTSVWGSHRWELHS